MHEWVMLGSVVKCFELPLVITALYKPLFPPNCDVKMISKQVMVLLLSEEDCSKAHKGEINAV